MRRSRASRWFEAAVVYAAMCALFIWHWLVPEGRALAPVSAGARRRPRRG
jgi:hypothetical protein